MAGRALTAVGLAVTFAVVLSAPAAYAVTNLIANGTFEGTGAGSLKGWAVPSQYGALNLAPGDGGGWAADVTAQSGAAKTYAYTSTKPVKSAVAGIGYTLDADIESGVPGQSVCLQLKELKAGTSTSVGSARSCISPGASWQAFPTVSYTVKTTGDALTVWVIENPAAAGADYAIDNVVLASQGDVQAPTVPSGVTASADSSTSVNVSWGASNDNVGVTGYDVYRDGTKVTTVGGGTTSWEDTTVAAGTRYSYTVDAFDAAFNTSAQSAPAVVTTPGGGKGPHEPVIVIMEENKTYSDIVGSPDAPYIQSLIANGTLYTNYEAGPGSLPDYLANTSGLTGNTSGSDNIFNQLQNAGVSWGEYEESMPSACYTGGDTGKYKKGHNPAVYYNDITSHPNACANVLPYSKFSTSNLRAFSYVVPNLADDMHDGADHSAQIKAGDNWLAANVPAMLSAGAEVIVTWDEGNSSDEHVATIAIGGSAAAGATDGTRYTHPGLLAGLEDAWGFPLLNAAQTATPLPIS